ncbi:Fic family protein (plasmid) [Dyella sp. BiH032]|uniref:Fic/DOC family protein n=1 Tax=Dyella sp. BiH032 TaxID=3075430 RepID=UPI00289374FC|nr:Fic family protein [Dyella sp. BiH032]WNL48589.1 Fic family protein [Dyella sp. BiH032]
MDSYQQPNGVLKNKLGITDEATLKLKEARVTALRTATLEDSGAFQHEGFDRLKAIHGHVFQDVYEWAGQARTTELGKAAFDDGEDVTRFTSPQRIEQEAGRIFGGVAAENNFRGLDRVTFAHKAAQHFAEINELHPFREGNGRAQVAYIGRLAQEAGHSLDFTGVSRERMVSASIAATRGNLEPMQRMFDELSDPTRARPLGIAADFLEQNRAALGADWREHYLSTTTPGQDYRGDFLVMDGERKHFIMLQRRPDRFVVANAQDLPGNGEGLKFGQTVQFTATLTPEQAAQRWLDRVALEAPRGRLASSLEAEFHNLSRDAASPSLSTAQARKQWAEETWQRAKDQPGNPWGNDHAAAQPALMRAAEDAGLRRHQAREILPHVQAALPRQLERAQQSDRMLNVKKVDKGQGLDFVR